MKVNILDVIKQKDLDVDYTSAKILASPYDYNLSKRIMVRNMDVSYVNIYEKGCRTEDSLCNQLALDYATRYPDINPKFKVGSLPKVGDFLKSLKDYEYSTGMFGSLIEYNNLNINEESLLGDMSYILGGDPNAGTVRNMKSKGYLKALEVLQLKGIGTDSLVPNLFYLTTSFYDKSLNDIENITFAEHTINAGHSPLFYNFRDLPKDEDLKSDELFPASMFILPEKGYFDINKGLAKDIPEEFFRLGLAYSIVYGIELLYQYTQIKDNKIKEVLDELLSVTYENKSFCAKFLYTIDSYGVLEPVDEVKACLISDNETRFNAIRNYLLSSKVLDAINSDIKSKLNEPDFRLPIMFMKMIASMHAYAYQVARIKHAVLLYNTAKEKDVLDTEDLENVCDGDSTEFCGVGSGEEAMTDELFDLTHEAYKNTENFKENLDAEKDVTDLRKPTGPTLNTLDSLKKDLDDSKYTYDIVYVKNSVSDKEAYNVISNRVKMLSHELTKQIKEIRTYNTGGKQSGLLVGKLDKKNLWRYKTDPHIFYNNNYKLKEMDLAFGCILDESGSMYGEKIKNGRIVMILLHEVLNSLGINHSIIGHTSDNTNQSKIFKYVQFKEEPHYSLEKPYGLVKAQARWGNCDSGALYYMESSLKQVRNKDKIVIIFSDGQPSECTGKDLIDQVRHMEKNGIHVIGVGINFDSIKEYYSDNANGKNLKEMIDIVVSILKRYVLEKKE